SESSARQESRHSHQVTCGHGTESKQRHLGFVPRPYRDAQSSNVQEGRATNSRRRKTESMRNILARAQFIIRLHARSRPILLENLPSVLINENVLLDQRERSPRSTRTFSSINENVLLDQRERSPRSTRTFSSTERVSAPVPSTALTICSRFVLITWTILAQVARHIRR